MRALRLLFWPVGAVMRYRKVARVIRAVLLLVAMGKAVSHFNDFRPFYAASSVSAVAVNSMYNLFWRTP